MCMGKEDDSKLIAIALVNTVKTYEFTLKEKKYKEI